MRAEYDESAPFHGTTTGYTQYGCRCEACVAKIRDYRRGKRRDNLTRLKALPERGALQNITHGASAYNEGKCRCDVCRNAVTKQRADSKTRSVQRALDAFNGHVLADTVPKPKRVYEELVKAEPERELTWNEKLAADDPTRDPRGGASEMVVKKWNDRERATIMGMHLFDEQRARYQGWLDEADAENGVTPTLAPAVIPDDDSGELVPNPLLMSLEDRTAENMGLSEMPEETTGEEFVGGF